MNEAQGQTLKMQESGLAKKGASEKSLSRSLGLECESSSFNVPLLGCPSLTVGASEQAHLIGFFRTIIIFSERLLNRRGP